MQGNADFHQMVADIAGITRKEAKTVNLGIMYGMGKEEAGGVMDYREEEATDLLDKYHEKVPFVKGIADSSYEPAQIWCIRTYLVVSAGLICGNQSLRLQQSY